MNNRIILGAKFDQWPPEPGQMHFNEGGFEHLIESDYEQACEYGKEIHNAFAAGGVTLAHTLSVVGEALMECDLDLEAKVQQTAFFKGIVEAAIDSPT